MPENVELNANRVVSALMIAAVLWIYSTVTDVHSRVVKLETNYDHTVNRLHSLSERLSALDRRQP